MMATIVTEEEEMMHNGEALPILSASAKNMKIEKFPKERICPST